FSESLERAVGRVIHPLVELVDHLARSLQLFLKRLLQLFQQLHIALLLGFLMNLLLGYTSHPVYANESVLQAKYMVQPRKRGGEGEKGACFCKKDFIGP